MRLPPTATCVSKKELQTEGTVIQIGVAPRRIDILTSLSGVRFKEVFERSIPIEIESLQLRVPAIEDLIRNKKVTGRIKDLADVEVWESLKVIKQ